MPHNYARSRRKILAPLALAGMIGLLVTACQNAAPVRLVITPASGSAAANPGDPITVTATGGKIKTVTVTATGGKIKTVDTTGDPVSGALNRGHTKWRSNGTLPVDKKLTVTVKAVNAYGQIVRRATTFRTMRPARTFTAKITEGYQQEYGVGMPIILTFSQPITNRQAVERSLQITTSKPVVGAWYWDNSQTVFFRPRDYWPADTSVSFTGDFNGVEGAPGVYGAHTLRQQFRIGPSVIIVASTVTHQLKLYRNGTLADTWPISTGRPGDDTPDGTYLVLGKGNPVQMTGPGYSISVPWSVQFTDTGDFVHDAYWSVGEQGYVNVSHGCVNISPADSEIYYNMAWQGNPVTVTGSPRPGVWDNGWTQWFLTWQEFLRGSALHEAVVAGPNGSTFVNPATLAPSTGTSPTQTSAPGNANAGAGAGASTS